MNLPDRETQDIRRGVLLHDIGKMGIPDSILHKPGQLTDDEWEVMRKHPQYAFDMLAPIVYLRNSLDIPYCHHEKWDGTGYPRRLKGETIPLAARIFSIVDVFDALTSDRPYRKAWSKEKTIKYIRTIGETFRSPRCGCLPQTDRYVNMRISGNSSGKTGHERYRRFVSSEWVMAAISFDVYSKSAARLEAASLNASPHARR